MKIAFLHTSASHIERFDKIIQAIDTNLEVEHVVNAGLLESALSTGKIDKEGFHKTIRDIKQAAFQGIICTCSTYGNLCEEEALVYRIDQPIATYIVENFSNIGIAYTVNSTKVISRNLIENLAKNNNQSIQITEINCEHCWTWFEQGDYERYEIEIARQIEKSAANCELVFLAQASMEGAKEHIKELNFEIVSSPAYGVKKHLDTIRKMSS